MLGISFYLYEVGSARAPKGFPWWTAGMKIDPRVPNTLIRKDYSIVNFTNIYSVSTQIRYLSKPQKWYSAAGAQVKRFSFVFAWACGLLLATMKPSHDTEKRNTRKTAPLWLSRPR